MKETKLKPYWYPDSRMRIRGRVAPHWLANLLWGVRWGAIMAFGYSLIAIAISILSLSTKLLHGQVTIFQVVLTYWIGGIVGGAIVGLLRPLTRTKPGTALVGFVAAVPLTASILGLTHKPTTSWTRELVIILALSLILGPVFAIRIRDAPDSLR